jgi:hypothetical protein
MGVAAEARKAGSRRCGAVRGSRVCTAGHACTLARLRPPHPRAQTSRPPYREMRDGVTDERFCGGTGKHAGSKLRPWLR